VSTREDNGGGVGSKLGKKGKYPRGGTEKVPINVRWELTMRGLKTREVPEEIQGRKGKKNPIR